MRLCLSAQWLIVCAHSSTVSAAARTPVAPHLGSRTQRFPRYTGARTSRLRLICGRQWLTVVLANISRVRGPVTCPAWTLVPKRCAVQPAEQVPLNLAARIHSKQRDHAHMLDKDHHASLLRVKKRTFHPWCHAG